MIESEQSAMEGAAIGIPNLRKFLVRFGATVTVLALVLYFSGSWDAHHDILVMAALAGAVLGIAIAVIVTVAALLLRRRKGGLALTTVPKEEWRKGHGEMAMKCPNCGAENPDYVLYCGQCASEMKGGLAPTTRGDDSDKPHSTTKIESILSRNILRIEENVGKKRSGVLGKFRWGFWRSGTMVFKSECEEVTLSVDREGHASVREGVPTNPGIELEGPHDSFLEMLREERNIRGIPSPITIRLGGREPPDERSTLMFRDVIGKLLHALLE